MSPFTGALIPPWSVPLVVFALYLAGAESSWRWFGAGSIGLAFYPPAGVSLVGLLISRRGLWPAVLGAALIAEVAVSRAHDLRWNYALGYAAANLVEAVVGASLLQLSGWQVARPRNLTQRRDLVHFLLLGGLVGPATGGVIAASVKVAESNASWSVALSNWVAGDGLGVALIGGSLLTLIGMRPDDASWSWRRAVTIALATFVLAEVTFRFWEHSAPLLVLPALIWIALRFEIPGVATSGLVLGFVANYEGANGHGPFVRLTDVGPDARLTLTQAFLFGTVMSAWFSAIAVHDRSVAESQRELADSQRRFAQLMGHAGALAAEVATVFTTEDLRARSAARTAQALGSTELALDLRGSQSGTYELVTAADGLSADVANSAPRWRGAVTTVAATTSSCTWLSVPLLDGAVAIGSMVLVWEGTHPVNAAERELLERMAQTITNALIRIRLSLAEHRAVERMAALQSLTAQLGRTRTTADVQSLVLRSGADLGLGRLELHVDATEGPAASGCTVATVQSDHQILGHLRAEGEASIEDRRMIEAVAELCAQAVERNRLAEFEHDIAVRLQRSLLGSVDPVLGLATRTVYRPAEDRLDAGGDWYDLVDLGQGRALLVVGDVVGHSVDAAAAMGQLRSAVRALAAVAQGPADLLERLEAFVARLPTARYSTILVAYLNTRDGLLEFSSAGHPPPLLVRSDGGVVFVEGGRGGPIGSFVQAPRTNQTTRLHPGDMIILFTDGLIERRGESMDVGLDRLAEVVAASDRENNWPDPLVDHMLAGVRQRDDVALLAVCLSATSFRACVPADPSELAGVRARLRRWLGDLGVSATGVEEILVTTGEALANAVEHAYRSSPLRPVELTAEFTGDLVMATIRDEGQWHDTSSGPLRGRGLGIMRQLADHVEIGPSPTGTVVRIRHAVTAERPTDDRPNPRAGR